MTKKLDFPFQAANNPAQEGYGAKSKHPKHGKPTRNVLPMCEVSSVKLKIKTTNVRMIFSENQLFQLP